ncbi:flagellar basal body rod protein FlgB [Rhodobacter sp. NSM]|uniref:flagellar basal body rod protein FlgB n=1 Tax=Rhodobacter sp. NSM TaxID=3457501 RepID=UPI003FD3552C
MSVSGFRDQLGLHAEALVLRETRNNLLTSNIANAATPHYKARDIDFGAELARATGSGTLMTTEARHIPVGGPAGTGQALYRDPVSPSLDGNTVEMGVEQMEFAENTLRYQTSLALLNRRISGLMTAIKGE